jgi:5'-AMP-activated protein kinase, regulatory gamma subunit
VRTSYDVLPLSFRLIVFDTALLVKKSLNILIHNGSVLHRCCPSDRRMLTTTITRHRICAVVGLQDIDLCRLADYVGLHQRHTILLAESGCLSGCGSVSLKQSARYANCGVLLSAAANVWHKEIERAIGVHPIETVSIHPLKPLYEACRKMLESRARRIPLLDEDDETNRSMVVSVVTQYRILKFIAVNVKETQMLRKPLRDLNVGTYRNLQTTKMESPVMDVIHMLVKYSISSIPILDHDG